MPKIYDNFENHLTQGLNETLEVSQRTDFCVGYFNLRGWKEIAAKIDDLSGSIVAEVKGDYHRVCRLLVGMQKLPAIPKVSTASETSIIKKIKSNKSISTFIVSSSQYKVLHTRKLRYFLQFLNTAPQIFEEDGSKRVTSELKEICFNSDEDRLVTNATYLSSLFFWYYISYSDCRNLNKREVATFPFDMQKARKDIRTQLANSTTLLLSDLQENSFFQNTFYKKYGNLRMQIFQPRQSKFIIDEIDKVLAKHFGFTAEELDFIINYDIKYRMGKELEEEDE